MQMGITKALTDVIPTTQTSISVRSHTLVLFPSNFLIDHKIIFENLPVEH